MRAIPRPRGTAAALCLGLLAAAPATASADTLLSDTLTAPAAKERRCHARLADGPGVVQRTVRLDRPSQIRARLTGSRGDWDLGIFDAAGRSVAGSAAFGTQELADGFAAPGTLTVQACRRSGPSGEPELTVSAFALPKPSGRKQIAKLVNVQVRNAAQRRMLEELGLDVEPGSTRHVGVLLIGAQDERKLQRTGLGYTVQIADLAAHSERNQRLNARYARSTKRSGLPSGRDDYRRLPDYQADMKALVEEHPDLVKPVVLPHASLEGRQIAGVEITEDVHAQDGKPVFLQLGVHHAREWPSSEHAMEWAVDLAKGFGHDDRTTRLLGQTRTIVVPVVNPDGFNLSREAEVDLRFLAEADPYVDPILIGAGPTLDATPIGDPGLTQPGLIAAILFDQEAGFFAYKRRNCRLAEGEKPAEGECGQRDNRLLGTDPNRNYGGFWGGPGADSDPTSDTFRGHGPFSEPETQNVRHLVSTRQVTTLITNHTFSNLVLRPPGIKSEGLSPDEESHYKPLGDAMAVSNGYKSQYSWQLYDTTGTTEDWSYYATGGLGFTFEIGPHEFHPPFEDVVAEYDGTAGTGDGGGNREAYFTALESTADTASHGVVTGEAAPGTTLRLKKSFTTWSSSVISPDGKLLDPIQQPETLETEMKVGDSGAFAWHVNPSQRPFAKRDRTFVASAEAPSRTQAIAPTDPPRPGTGEDLYRFDVTDADAVVRVFIEVADTDDYDLYLHEGGGEPTAENQIGSSGGFLGVDEQIVKPGLAPGTYTVRVANYAATTPYSGGIEFYSGGKEIFVPAEQESWTLECERGGEVVASRQVDVDRGQRVDVGEVCGKVKGGRNKGQRPDKPPKADR